MLSKSPSRLIGVVAGARERVQSLLAKLTHRHYVGAIAAKSNTQCYRSIPAALWDKGEFPGNFMNNWSQRISTKLQAHSLVDLMEAGFYLSYTGRDRRGKPLTP